MYIINIDIFNICIVYSIEKTKTTTSIYVSVIAYTYTYMNTYYLIHESI